MWRTFPVDILCKSSNELTLLVWDFHRCYKCGGHEGVTASFFPAVMDSEEAASYFQLGLLNRYQLSFHGSSILYLDSPTDATILVL